MAGRQCWSCDANVEDETSITSIGKVPKPGDVAICAYCGALGTFDDQHEIRQVTLAERLEAGRHPEIAIALNLIAQRN